VIGFAVSFLIAAALVIAPAPAEAPPNLSVVVTDEAGELRRGDTLVYVATVTNNGGEAFAGILTVETPSYFDIVASGSTLAGTAARWSFELAPSESQRFEASAKVGEVAAGEYQAIVTASVASPTAPDDIVVRATDANRIAGTDPPPAVPNFGDPGADPALPWTIGALVGVVLVLTVAVVVLVRWRQREPR